MKTKINNLHVQKSKIIPFDLNNLGNVVDYHVATNIVYDKLVNKVNAFDTKIQSSSEFVAKTKYYIKKQGLQKNNENADKIYN